jgi:hypothetical protein
MEQYQSEPVCNITCGQQHMLNDKWVLFHHLPSNKNWSLSGYTIIMDNIDTVEKAIAINEIIPDKMIKFSMLFLMRSGIPPLWEDPNNKLGGCFSYKVINKYVEQVWKQMFYLACGESLGLNESYSANINGITISPKKNFCIIKIWLKDTNHQDPNMIQTIEYLTKNGVMFKTHGEA